MAKQIRRRLRLHDSKKRNKTYLPVMGSLDAPVWMILDPMVNASGASLTPMSKDIAEWFVAHARDNGKFGKADVCIISCAPPMTYDNWKQNKVVSAHLKEHREELLELIKTNKPKFIMPFGARACAQLVGRAVQITKVRGQPVQEPEIAFGTPFLPMLSPFYARAYPENEATFIADMQTAGRIFRADYDLEAATIDYKRDYSWCYDLSFLIRNPQRRLSVDVETLGLYPFSDKTKLLTVQISWAPGKAVIIPIDYDRGPLRHHGFIPWKKGMREKLVKQLKIILEDPKTAIEGQNFKFDWLMLWYKLGIRVANYADDSMLLAHLLDENQKKMNIDDLVRRYVPAMAGFNDPYNNDPEHHQKSRMDLLTPEKMLQYGCGDPDAAMRLVDSLKDALEQDPAVMACYNYVTMPAQRAFCDIEQNGFPVSKKALGAFQRMLRLKQKKERVYLLKKIPQSIKNKWRDSGVGVKVTRSAILKDWLYDHPDGLRLEPVAFTKTGMPSVSSKDAMPYYVADHPVIQRLIDYIKNDKLLNTYAKGFWKYIYDDMIRPSYGLTGTTTGRSMSRDPNGQNFPKRGKLAKEYRRIFQAPKGWVFLSCDLSQAELRIAAMMSNDPTMLAVYASGGDIHRQTAAGTMGLTLEEFLELPQEEQDLKRFQAKAVNFGFLYGMWWKKFRSYAKTDYGIDFTEAEAQAIRINFFKTYPMLLRWHDEVQEVVMRKGYVRTYDGRIRHLPNVRSKDEGISRQAQRQAINSPVQSIASDLGLMTLGRLVPFLRKKGYDEWLKPCGFIHDAIVCLVREDMVAKGANIVKHYMENNPLEQWFNWIPEIPIIADAEIGRTLADTYEISADRFVPKAHHNKSYADFLMEELDSNKRKLAGTMDEEKAVKLRKTIAFIEGELSECQYPPSTRRPKKRNIVIRQRTTRRTSNDKASTTSLPKGKAASIPEIKGRGPRTVKRRKSA